MNCIIVDDEFPSREELKYFINNFSNINIIKEFSDSINALEYMEKNKTDIVFLDINMPHINGMTLGRMLSKINEGIKIIFITAYKDYAVEAFEIEAFDYILKPYSEERILGLLNKLCKPESATKHYSRLTLWKNDKMVVIDVKDICYCESHERHTYIHTNEDRYEMNSTMTECYSKLSKEKFFKTHRSYIVNIDKIKEIIPWFNNTYVIKFQGLEAEVPVSRNNINEFKHIMGV